MRKGPRGLAVRALTYTTPAASTPRRRPAGGAPGAAFKPPNASQPGSRLPRPHEGPRPYSPVPREPPSQLAPRGSHAAPGFPKVVFRTAAPNSRRSGLTCKTGLFAFVTRPDWSFIAEENVAIRHLPPLLP